MKRAKKSLLCPKKYLIDALIKPRYNSESTKPGVAVFPSEQNGGNHRENRIFQAPGLNTPTADLIYSTLPESLMKNETLFHRAFEDTAIGMALLAVNPLGKYIEVNPSFCRMTGYSREELLKRDFQSITAAADLGKNLEQLNTLLAGTIPSI